MKKFIHHDPAREYICLDKLSSSFGSRFEQESVTLTFKSTAV